MRRGITALDGTIALLVVLLIVQVWLLCPQRSMPIWRVTAMLLYRELYAVGSSLPERSGCIDSCNTLNVRDNRLFSGRQPHLSSPSFACGRTGSMEFIMGYFAQRALNRAVI